MQPSRKIPDIHEIIMNTSPLDKGTLGGGNKDIHVRTEPNGEYLRNNLSDGMDEANGAVVGDALRILLLGQKDHVGGVEPMKV